MNEFTTITKCRSCHSATIVEVLRFSEQYVGTIFVESNESNSMSTVKIPLTLLLCKNCGLIQLKETVKPELLFTNYFYRTGVNQTMKRDLHDVVDYALNNIKIESDDYVVDIGANDCTMIGMFTPNLHRIAVEPAKNIDWSHVDKSITILNNYFSKEVVLNVTNEKKVKIITSTAMFYDLDDPNLMTKDIKAILDKNGICVIQVSYLLDTIRDMNFYDVVHEHLEYYSLKSINYLMENNGLQIIDASTNFTNGGSLRILVTHKENKIPKSKQFEDILFEEEKWKLDDPQTYIHYWNKIQNIIKKSKNFVLNEINNDGFVIGLGASTKGNVLLQICEIDKKMLPYISERNREKVGLRTLGTDIEIISEEKARHLNPSCMLVIPWNFKEEILEREKVYIQNGGKMLFLIPYPHVIDKNGEKKIE